jgi:sigma-B regulation protein RsbU (phosphoserine phosphatase)
MSDPGRVRQEEGPPTEDLEDLYENAPCGYLSLQPNGRIVKVNATFCDWTGYSPAELTGKRLSDLLNVAGKIFYETHVAPLLRMQGFFHEVALDIVTANGKRIPVLANAAERRGPDGQVRFIRLTIFEAIQRRRYERDLVAMRQAAETAHKTLQAVNAGLEARIAEAVTARLQAERGLSRIQAEEASSRTSLMAEKEAAKLREQFIAVLGHDLRNPLMGISAGVEIVSRLPQDEKAQRVLEMMRGSIARMTALIENITDFARGRLGTGLLLNRTEERLDLILNQVVAELQLAHPNRAIEIDINLSRPIKIDRFRVGQLVSNLLANALTHGALDRPVRLYAAIDGQDLDLWVANSGTPIPEAAMERLFQPFFRGEARPGQQGLGLGLYIASEIARAHNGVLIVSSSPDETRFTFRMPLA